MQRIPLVIHNAATSVFHYEDCVFKVISNAGLAIFFLFLNHVFNGAAWDVWIFFSLIETYLVLFPYV